MERRFPRLIVGQLYVVQSETSISKVRFVGETESALMFETDDRKPRMIDYRNKVIEPATALLIHRSAVKDFPDYRKLMYSLYGDAGDLHILGPSYSILYVIGEEHETQLLIEKDLEYHPSGYVITIIEPSKKKIRKPISVLEFNNLINTLGDKIKF